MRKRIRQQGSIVERVAGDHFAGNIVRLTEIVLADDLGEQQFGRKVEVVLGHVVARAE